MEMEILLFFYSSVLYTDVHMVPNPMEHAEGLVWCFSALLRGVQAPCRSAGCPCRVKSEPFPESAAKVFLCLTWRASGRAGTHKTDGLWTDEVCQETLQRRGARHGGREAVPHTHTHRTDICPLRAAVLLRFPARSPIPASHRL